MTILDWAIVAFALALGLWGYRQGLIVGTLTLVGFAIGAFAGSRLGCFFRFRSFSSCFQ